MKMQELRSLRNEDTIKRLKNWIQMLEAGEAGVYDEILVSENRAGLELRKLELTLCMTPKQSKRKK